MQGCNHVRLCTFRQLTFFKNILFYCFVNVCACMFVHTGFLDYKCSIYFVHILNITAFILILFFVKILIFSRPLINEILKEFEEGIIIQLKILKFKIVMFIITCYYHHHRSQHQKVISKMHHIFY